VVITVSIVSRPEGQNFFCALAFRRLVRRLPYKIPENSLAPAPGHRPMTSNPPSGDELPLTDKAGHAAPPNTELQHNALGLLTTAALTAAYMGPAISMYALFGEMWKQVGTGVGFVMLIAMALTLMSAISFGMLAKELPSAGGVYAWSRKALGERVGTWIGLSTSLYFTISLIPPLIVFGQFFNTFLRQLNIPLDAWEPFGVPGHIWTWLLGAVIMMTLSAWIAYRGIVVSSHMAFTLLLIELAVIVALAITFLVVSIRNGTASFAPLSLSACKDGWKSVVLALPMALMCMVCDAAVPTAEETRNAKWTIPLAVVLTCFLIGLWYVFGFSAFAMVRPAINTEVTGTESIVAPMAAHVWGPWSILVSVTAMTAALGAQIPILTAASRVMFAMARENRLPALFARLHPDLRAPWNALHFLCAFTVLGTIPAVLIFGADETIGWWSYILGWFIAVVYFAANLVNVVYYFRFARNRFNPILNGLVPAIAMAAQIWFVHRYLVVELGESGAKGRSVQVAIAVSAVATMLYVGYLSVWRKQPDKTATEDPTQ
jgi:amino acid transporter